MIYLVVLVVLVTATASATRLVTTDAITEGLRRRIGDKLGAEHKITYLIWCDWCSAFWTAAVIAAPAAYGLAQVWPLWAAVTAYPILVLSLRYSAAYLLSREE